MWDRESCGMFIYSQADSMCKHEVGKGEGAKTELERERDRKREESAKLNQICWSCLSTSS